MDLPHQNTPFSTNKTLNLGGRLIDLSTPAIMGIVNVTPDSFFSGSRFGNDAALIQGVKQMIDDGATIIDVGGYSSRPGAEHIPSSEEESRVIPVIRRLKKEFPDILLSVDTFRGSVARAAHDEGAVMINDISAGLLDPTIADVAGERRMPCVVMHMRGTPQTMQTLTSYDDLVGEVMAFFHARIAVFREKGVYDIVIDPGFGFAKTVSQNFALLRQLDNFGLFDQPLMVGLSRKSMVWRTLKTTPGESLNGTAALHAVALLKGASVLRVHDVKAAREVIDLHLMMRAAAL